MAAAAVGLNIPFNLLLMSPPAPIVQSPPTHHERAPPPKVRFQSPGGSMEAGSLSNMEVESAFASAPPSDIAPEDETAHGTPLPPGRLMYAKSGGWRRGPAWCGA